MKKVGILFLLAMQGVCGMQSAGQLTAQNTIEFRAYERPYEERDGVVTLQSEGVFTINAGGTFTVNQKDKTINRFFNFAAAGSRVGTNPTYTDQVYRKYGFAVNGVLSSNYSSEHPFSGECSACCSVGYRVDGNGTAHITIGDEKYKADLRFPVIALDKV